MAFLSGGTRPHDILATRSALTAAIPLPQLLLMATSLACHDEVLARQYRGQTVNRSEEEALQKLYRSRPEPVITSSRRISCNRNVWREVVLVREDYTPATGYPHFSDEAALMRDGSAVVLRRPVVSDATEIHDLIAACPPLDQNSLYCNLLHCSDFAGTCVLARRGRTPVGWLSAYRKPDNPSSLFIWQVAVHPEARGSGLGKLLVFSVLKRQACTGIRDIVTTVTLSNVRSRALFAAIARDMKAPCTQRLWFDRAVHFKGTHESEHLITIGPFSFNHETADALPR